MQITTIDISIISSIILLIRMLIIKINIQSSIIKSLENYNKTFDIDKINKLIELCDIAKEKQLNLERKNLQKEFQLRKYNFLLKHSKINNFNQFLEIK